MARWAWLRVLLWTAWRRYWVKDTVAQGCLHLRDSVQISLPYISIYNIIQHYYVYNTVYIYILYTHSIDSIVKRLMMLVMRYLVLLFYFLQKNHEATQGCFNKLVGIEV